MKVSTHTRNMVKKNTQQNNHGLLQAIGEGDEDEDSDQDSDGVPGPTHSQIMDMEQEQLDEEAQQASELQLFSTIVQAPLQILDLAINDPLFYFAKSTGEQEGQRDFILLNILRNFKGTQLKLTIPLFDPEMEPERLDFDWACQSTLRYFKLQNPVSLKTKVISILAKRLALMPELNKVKLDSLW